jgi:isopenicillin N synthase-like dioxygenase
MTPLSFRLYREDFDAFAQGLGASFASTGFAVIADHGLSQVGIEAAAQSARAFFALPAEVKLKYRVAGGAGQRGYTPFGVERAKDAAHHDLKEFWHVGREPPANLWPQEVPGFEARQLWLYEALEGLGRQLLRAIARYLDLAPDFFEPPTRQGDSVLRLLHYPPGPFDGPQVRAAAHEDINAITLLLGAEEAGLELKDRQGAWRAVETPPGCVVCNIGDMLQRLTNHLLVSTTHRVVNPAPERRGVSRYSTPFFLHFASDYEIRTLPSWVSAERPDLYPRPITAGDFLAERLKEIGLMEEGAS